MTPEAFYADELSVSFAWESQTDCVHTADRWCVANGRPSFVDAAGYDYITEAHACSLARRLSMPIRVARAMRAAGYLMTREPRAGDVGLVVADQFAACAVRGTPGWIFRSEHGLTCFGPKARLLMAWSVLP